MKRVLVIALVLLLAWLATGFYVVQGNEQAVVRRFGRLVTEGEGRAQLARSGLHFDLPWPLAQIDRVNLNAVRTLSIGDVDLDLDDQFLQTVDPSIESQFLTGDKNVLNVQIAVHYRIGEADVARWLFGFDDPEARLRALVETAASDLISRSGVDFVHPLGLGELRRQLTEATRSGAGEQRLGVIIDEVTISAVAPPVQVKAWFLDVANARADKDKYIESALTFAEQELQAAAARRQETIDAAEIDRRQLVETSRGSADRFRRIVAQFRRDASTGGRTYAAVRGLAMRRMYFDAVEEILQNVQGKVFLDSGKPVDLTIFRNPDE